ncbi:hypothetical protein PVK06_039630 [Gossypium arboreum]|uniref:Uncharacterized protein n=1 Tax=Gossypium arboreum TaxID=29729 RepID=A0ABR0N444_GOSAR|nr:hypothetical protein PVK06_039630 [Gossypium arboreum]
MLKRLDTPNLLLLLPLLTIAKALQAYSLAPVLPEMDAMVYVSGGASLYHPFRFRKSKNTNSSRQEKNSLPSLPLFIGFSLNDKDEEDSALLSSMYSALLSSILQITDKQSLSTSIFRKPILAPIKTAWKLPTTYSKTIDKLYHSKCEHPSVEQGVKEWLESTEHHQQQRILNSLILISKYQCIYPNRDLRTRTNSPVHSSLQNALGDSYASPGIGRSVIVVTNTGKCSDSLSQQALQRKLSEG